MNPEKFTEQIIKVIDEAVSKFNSSLAHLQEGAYKKLVELSKDLKTKDGTLLNTAENYRQVIKLRTELERAILNEGYLKQVAEFVKAFDEVAKLQNEFYREMDKSFKASELNQIIRRDAITSAIESLTESGINSQVVNKLEQLLKESVSGGAHFADLQKTLKEFILDTEAGEGKLSRYVKQITTDALNQYSANYNQAITSDLGLEWFVYQGTLLTTSRPFCEHMVKKRYIHRSEFATVLKGRIDGEKLALNPRTDLPEGMIAGTTPSNFPTYRGGWQCGHQLIAVSEMFVPESAKAKVRAGV